MKKRGTKTNADFANSVQFHKQKTELAIAHAKQLEAKLKLAIEIADEFEGLTSKPEHAWQESDYDRQRELSIALAELRKA